MSDVQKFIREHDGDTVGVGASRGQCVGLARMWISLLEGTWDEPAARRGYRTMPRVAAAKDFYDVAPSRFWRKVRPTASTPPPRGALVIFDATPGNRYGHVGIATGKWGPTPGTIQTFDQNYGTPGRCRLESHRLSGVRGYLAFKG